MNPEDDRASHTSTTTDYSYDEGKSSSKSWMFKEL